ncbi:MAG: FMN-binding protein [Bacteroidales bacterium]|nr:FMN-binding protein [Bacteroidales bacterium]
MKHLLILTIMAVLMMPVVATAQNDKQNDKKKSLSQGDNRIKAAEGAGSASSLFVPEEIRNAFPTAESTKEEGMLRAVYAEGKLLGYALYSKPASDGIKGYAGETPLLIALTPEKTVLSVQMLPNQETPNIAEKVRKSTLLQSWNGLTLKKARKKRVDAVSGATYTSKSVIKSLRAAVKKAQK